MWSNVIAASEKEETSPESASSAWRQSAIRSCIGKITTRDGVRVCRFDIEYNQNEILLSCRARLSSRCSSRCGARRLRQKRGVLPQTSFDGGRAGFKRTGVVF